MAGVGNGNRALKLQELHVNCGEDCRAEFWRARGMHGSGACGRAENWHTRGAARSMHGSGACGCTSLAGCPGLPGPGLPGPWPPETSIALCGRLRTGGVPPARWIVNPRLGGVCTAVLPRPPPGAPGSGAPGLPPAAALGALPPRPPPRAPCCACWGGLNPRMGIMPGPYCMACMH